MILRVLQILVTILWVGMTSALVVRNYWGDERHFPKVDPERVVSRFLEKEYHGDLLIIRDEAFLGRLVVTPREPRTWNVEGHPLSEGAREIYLSLPNSLNLADEGWLGWIEGYASFFLKSDLHLDAIRVQALSPENRMSGLVQAKLDPFYFRYQARQEGKILLDSLQPELMQEWVQVAHDAGLTAGLDPSILELLNQPNLFTQMAQAFHGQLIPRVQCRKGRFQIFSGRYRGYILYLQWEGNMELRFYMSEAGDLLKVGGVPGVEILAEAFVPIEMLGDELLGAL